ncbi:MAG: SPFH domain-containing protein [Planctomycetota bacterium]
MPDEQEPTSPAPGATPGPMPGATPGQESSPEPAAPKVAERLEDVAVEREHVRDDYLTSGNTALADALAKSFAVLKYVMLALVVVFILSGFFTVNSNEVAVRTMFGRIVPAGDGSDVLSSEGGPYFRWPSPIGEVYRISTQTQTLRIEEAFVFQSGRQRPATPLAELNAGDQLNPVIDGSLLTGDQNIVHARYTVNYRVDRSRAGEFIRNVAGPGLNIAAGETEANWSLLKARPQLLFQQGDRVVRFAVEQAIVSEVAGQTIDEFRRNVGGQLTEAPGVLDAGPDSSATPPPAAPTDGTADDAAAAEGSGAAPSADTPAGGFVEQTDALELGRQTRIETRAQFVLDNVNSGIVIERILLDEQSVPPSTRAFFDAYTQAIQQVDAIKARGRTQAVEILTGAAGPAYEAVLAVIDAYETADRLRRAAPGDAEVQAAFETAESALASVFAGEPIGPALRAVAATLPPDDPRSGSFESLAVEFGSQRLGGRAALMIRQSDTESNTIVNVAQTEVSKFEALLENYRKAPRLVEQQLFFDALASVMSGQSNDIEVIPAGDGPLRIDAGEDAARRTRDSAQDIDNRADRIRGAGQ